MHAGFDRKGRQAGAEQISVDEAVIRRIWCGEVFEATAGPIKVTAVHDHTTNAGAVPTNKFGGAVNDDIGTPFKRTEEIGSGQGVIDQQWDLMFLCNLRNFFKWKDSDIRV